MLTCIMHNTPTCNAMSVARSPYLRAKHRAERERASSPQPRMETGANQTPTTQTPPIIAARVPPVQSCIYKYLFTCAARCGCAVLCATCILRVRRLQSRDAKRELCGPNHRRVEGETYIHMLSCSLSQPTTNQKKETI